MGGRGGSSGLSASRPSVSARTVEGIRGSVFSSYSEVRKSSPHAVWIENTNRPHAIIKTERGEMHLTGDKKNKFSLLENVNTAVVHLSGVDKGDPKREVARLNKQLEEIKSLGFDVPRINVGRDETVAYVKRTRFTRRY